MTYNEVLQRIIKAYHDVGYTCMAVLRKGIPTTQVDEWSVFRVIIRKQQLNVGKQPLMIVSSTLAQHEEIIAHIRITGNLDGLLRVREYDGKEE